MQLPTDAQFIAVLTEALAAMSSSGILLILLLQRRFFLAMDINVWFIPFTIGIVSIVLAVVSQYTPVAHLLAWASILAHWSFQIHEVSQKCIPFCLN